MPDQQNTEGRMFNHQEFSIPFNSATPTTVWLVYVVAALAYCSPMIIAFHRNVEYKWGLYFANLLLGFTVIAWAYCLYYAVFGDKEKPAKNLSLAA
jgi:hypothetical protein